MESGQFFSEKVDSFCGKFFSGQKWHYFKSISMNSGWIQMGSGHRVGTIYLLVVAKNRPDMTWLGREKAEKHEFRCVKSGDLNSGRSKTLRGWCGQCVGTPRYAQSDGTSPIATPR